MPALAAFLFQVAAVASCARGPRARRLLAGAVGACVTLVLCMRAYGPVCGALVALTMAMAAASLLVLVLAPRPTLAGPVAFGATTIAILLAGLSWGSP